MNRQDTAAVSIGFLAAFFPLIIWYFKRMSDGSDEPMGLVALAAAAVIAWSQRSRLTSTPTMRAWALAFVLIYGVTVWLTFPPLLRSLPALAAAICWFGLWRVPAIVVLLTLSLPLMASLQFYLGYPLRLCAAELARSLLSIVQVEVWRDGVELISNGTAVGVDAPCSGVRMLWAGAFLAAGVAGNFRLNWRGVLTLGGVAFVLAIATNALRVSLLFFPEAGIVHLPHWTHEATGILCFAIGIAGLLFAARRLQTRFAL